MVIAVSARTHGTSALGTWFLGNRGTALRVRGGVGNQLSPGL